MSGMVKKVEELLAADHPDITTLSQFRLSLKEKLEVLSKLDSEILMMKRALLMRLINRMELRKEYIQF